ncbi:CCA tRNA nucleotidyltransferase [Halopenitus persicus]|uniref:CCA-adding enzyme n=1 Tax=Halopenitus persicus TaxID=1048396 RepID=A0A1H3G4F7_9EURY|nr:CCA tRNA nucleotidyltransferase [Halopenitus persicus]QHS16869.1 CCA tRNA nucleotidyltransferase [haloarchaeon 3A1-DGR]SDX97259.1 tRNA adenylyltransferase [Halopenitus persicus]
MSDPESVRRSVLDRITPDPAERERLESVAARLVDRTRAAVAELDADLTAGPDGDVDVVRVGSTARGTWLSGDRDIDLFVRFPTDLPRADLERYGLSIGHAVLPDGHEEYAEHPYVTGTLEGFDVDLVPCYDVADASEIRSAVDRTPFHDAYLSARLTDDLAADVLLAKRFLKGIGAYGSDLRTRGFSGYLTELLVVEHGGFEPLLRAAADWHPPVRLDPEDHGTATFDDPLVVIDPTDPERNVAAVCSGRNLARLQHHARAYLADPSPTPFFPPAREPISADAVREHVDRRGTTPIAIVLEPPALVDDQLWPQLRKSRDGIVRALEDRQFPVLRSRTMVEGEPAAADRARGTGSADRGRAVILIEPLRESLPAVATHRGPPVAVREHAEGFYDAYADDGDPYTYGPFLDGDRYVVERERTITSAAAFLAEEDLSDVGLGAQLVDAIADREVLVGDDVASLADGFGRQLRSYFEPRP